MSYMSQILSIFYNRFAKLYDIACFIISRGNWYKFQKYISNEIKGTTVLDIGCGTSRWLSEVEASVDLCFGLDISKAMIDISKKRFKNIKSDNIFLIQGSAEFLPIKTNKIDTILITNPTNFILIDNFFSEIYRILSKNGVLIILDYPQFKKKTTINRILNILLLAGNKRDLDSIIKRIENIGFQVKAKHISNNGYISTLIRSEKVVF